MTEYAKLHPVTFEVRPIEEYRIVRSTSYFCLYRDEEGNLVGIHIDNKTISYCPANESLEVLDENGHLHGKNFKISRKINKRNPNEKKMFNNANHNENRAPDACLLI